MVTPGRRFELSSTADLRCLRALDLDFIFVAFRTHWTRLGRRAGISESEHRRHYLPHPRHRSAATSAFLARPFPANRIASETGRKRSRRSSVETPPVTPPKAIAGDNSPCVQQPARS